MDFRRAAGWWRGLSATSIRSEPGNGWKPLVSLTDRASCSCFVRLCVSKGRFVTSGPLAQRQETWGELNRQARDIVATGNARPLAVAAPARQAQLQALERARDRPAMVDAARAAAPPAPLMLPVPVPHFATHCRASPSAQVGGTFGFNCQ